MPRRIIEKIRNSIRSGNYDITYHAVDEMAEEEIGIFDLEKAILNGKIVKREKDDPRGIKYIIEGSGIESSKSIGVVCRFKKSSIFLIITVYKIS